MEVKTILHLASGLIALFLVVYLAVEDVRTGSAPLWALLGLIVLGGLWQCTRESVAWEGFISPLAGLSLFGLLAVVQCRKIGSADILAVFGLGCFVTWERLPYAILVSSITALIGALVIWFKAKSKVPLKQLQIPFLPFLVSGYTAAFFFPALNRSFAH